MLKCQILIVPNSPLVFMDNKWKFNFVQMVKKKQKTNFSKKKKKIRSVSVSFFNSNKKIKGENHLYCTRKTNCWSGGVYFFSN